MNLRVDEPKRPVSRGEGPSNLKGKSVDPRNWGAAGIDPSELDIESQRRAFNTWASAQNFAGGEIAPEAFAVPRSELHRRETPPHVDKKHYKATVEEVADNDAPAPRASRAVKGVTPLSDTMAQCVADTVEGCRSSKPVKARIGTEIKPISQVAPNSYLGKALGGLMSKRHGGGGRPPSPSDSSSSESSSSSSASSGSLGMSRSSKRKRGGRHRRCSRSKRSRCHHS